ncbi:MAG: hypothetical protein IKS98_11905 [Lachnospiraceae bacterium]|nr:hypothetical protein [Lachnospiraceae bacterium]
MNKKSLRSMCLSLCALALVLAAVLMIGTVPAKADTGKAVRVSTVKELKSAMKKSDVGTIYFRTQAYLNIKIPSVKNASGKELIIEAPNCVITNKSKFLNINILKAASYTEAVSGNVITLTGQYIDFTVAKKRTVTELTICDPALPDGNLEYTLRKGAKIKSLQLMYTKFELPQYSEYNAKKKTLTFSFKNRYEIDETHIYKLDKYGRVLSSVNPHPEFGTEAAFKYDKNGNLLTTTVDDNRGHIVETFTYDKKYRPIKSVSTEDGEFFNQYDYDYDAKGNLVKLSYKEAGDYTSVTEITYDSKGRPITNTTTGGDHSSKYVHTYDANGLRIKSEITVDGEKSTTYTYEYNKRGDKLKETWTSVANTKMVYGYYYDELGELIDRDYTDTDGDVHKMTLDGALLNSVY